jgi:hypothetical protein
VRQDTGSTSMMTNKTHMKEKLQDVLTASNEDSVKE